MSLYFYYYILFAYIFIHANHEGKVNMCGKTQQFTILLLVVKLLLLKLLLQKVFDQVSFVILQQILAKLL